MTVEPMSDTAPVGTMPEWVVTVRETAKLAGYIADTDFVPKAFRGNAAAVTAAMLYGAELGVGRMTALQTMSPIQGKVGISAELMRSLVLAAGHRIELVKLSTDRCTIKGQRAGSDSWQEVTWTLDDAKRADLRGEGWRKYPRSMLMARATTELCRFMFADVLHGMVAVEEYLDEPPSTSPAAVDSTPTTPTTARSEPAPRPARVIQRGSQTERKTAADSTPGVSPPPPKNTPAPTATAATPDTSHGAPGESVVPSKSAGAGGRKQPPKRSSTDSPEGVDRTPDAYLAPQSAPSGESLEDVPQDALPVDPDPDPETETEGEWLINRYALREYHALMRKLGVEDRDERMFVTRVLANRDDLSTSSDLTDEEGKAVLAALRRCSDRDALEVIIAAMHDATV